MIILFEIPDSMFIVYWIPNFLNKFWVNNNGISGRGKDENESLQVDQASQEE